MESFNKHYSLEVAVGNHRWDSHSIIDITIATVESLRIGCLKYSFYLL